MLCCAHEPLTETKSQLPGCHWGMYCPVQTLLPFTSSSTTPAFRVTSSSCIACWHHNCEEVDLRQPGEAVSRQQCCIHKSNESLLVTRKNRFFLLVKALIKKICFNGHRTDGSTFAISMTLRPERNGRAARASAAAGRRWSCPGRPAGPHQHRWRRPGIRTNAPQPAPGVPCTPVEPTQGGTILAAGSAPGRPAGP